MGEYAFIGRQPVFDRAHRTTAYELFVRDGADDLRPFGDRDRAARRLISAVVHRVGLDELVGGRTVWIPVTASLMAEGLHSRLPARRTVLVLPMSSWQNETLNDSILKARRAGYRIALDASTPTAGFSGEHLMEAAAKLGALRHLDAVKLGTDWLPQHEWEPWAVQLARQSILSVATGVDSRQTAALCGAFDLIQGRFAFDVAPTDGGPRVDRLAAMQLISQLECPDVSFEDIERLITHDPSLSVRVLLLANSGLYALARRMDTVRGALVILGMRNVRQMVLALTLSSLKGVNAELTATALVRARMCETVAPFVNGRADAGFTVGLLSLLDVFSGKPLQQSLAELPLTAEIRDAIAVGEGPLGLALRCVMACEQGRIAELATTVAPGRVLPTVEMLTESYERAVNWAERIRSGEHITVTSEAIDQPPQYSRSNSSAAVQQRR